MRVKMSKQPLPAPTAKAVGPCPTVIRIVGCPSTGSLPSTIAPPDHPFFVEGIFSSGSQLVYWSGMILAVLVGSHLGNIPEKFESHWPKGRVSF